FAVPQGQAEAQPALAVRDAQEPVLAPAVGPAAGVVVREVLPAGAARRVILADGAPLALGQVRAPALPVLLAPGVFPEPEGFGLGCLLSRHGSVRLRGAGEGCGFW